MKSKEMLPCGCGLYDGIFSEKINRGENCKQKYDGSHLGKQDGRPRSKFHSGTIVFYDLENVELDTKIMQIC